MTDLSIRPPKAASPAGAMPFSRLLLYCAMLIFVPVLLALSQGLTINNLFALLVSVLSIGGLAAMLLQFALAGRIPRFTRWAGIDNAMRLHRKTGEILALFFLLHPFLLVLPRFFVAPQLALSDLWTTFTATETATGFYAMSIMVVLVLASIFRDRLPMSYEAWRVSHGLGFAVVMILATDHAITNGRHGVYNNWFDAMWVILCALAVASILDAYLLRPWRLKKRPFKVVSVNQASDRDRVLTIEKDGDFDFDFKAGQFLWINTSGHVGNRTDHPFSIASTPQNMPRLSFVIRNLGDYTSGLDKLEPGQTVYLDGPHGDFTLDAAKGNSIVLIAGGAGIGPILGLLRQLNANKDPRSIHLYYGSRTEKDVVAWDEIEQIIATMENFKATKILEITNEEEAVAEKGYINQALLSRTLDKDQINDASFYVCGPPVMLEAVVHDIKKLGVPSSRVIFEHLTF
ncbi:ferredoxin reductase family protein [Cohaesibacter celericrescens]|uniref:ferredoxin reductase family protein n=1 Tax=Cohaesibacter celericrescens TaxID=2067669 RepID=UPI00356B1A07